MSALNRLKFVAILLTMLAFETAVVRAAIGRTTRGLKAARTLQGRDPESFRVLRDGAAIVLTGNGDRAVLYAVYDFLEQDLSLYEKENGKIL